MTNNRGGANRRDQPGRKKPVPRPSARQVPPSPRQSQSQHLPIVPPSVQSWKKPASGKNSPKSSASPQTTVPLSVIPPLDAIPVDPLPPRPQRSWFGFLQTWSFWGLTGTLVFLGTGALAAALLLKLPAIPNCPAIFWPTASASLRLYCAQLAANKQTVDDLLEAIALVNSLPPDHPLRPEVDRSIELWSQSILDLAKETFHRGDLDGAIAIAQRIPANTPAQREVKEQVGDWRAIWETAEGIYQQAESALTDQNPRLAFELAVKLLSVGNRYWETTKYQELNDLITASREDGRRLGRIRRLMARGGLSNLLEATKLLREIKPTSPAYPVVKRMMTQLGEKMLDLAEEALNRRDFNQALDIIRQIPEDANLQESIRDFNLLAQAQNQAWNGTVPDLESAILQAQRVGSNRPLFGKAQRLIARWQLEIQDVSRLDLSRQLAGGGDLRGAIAEASQIPRGNPRREEARELIAEWLTTVQTQEDQPLLDQADQLAASGNFTDLQAAVNLLQQIREGRALHSEARSRVQGWTRQIQEAQDRPILEQARQQAALGNIPEAIRIARSISPGRALYDQAQDEIQAWQTQTEGENRLQQAIQTANIGTPPMLLEAIRIASRVPSGSTARLEADNLINRWSVEVLRAAQAQASFDPAGAIALLESIPASTAAYAEAQQQLSALRQLQAPPTLSTPLPTPQLSE